MIWLDNISTTKSPGISYCSSQIASATCLHHVNQTMHELTSLVIRPSCVCWQKRIASCHSETGTKQDWIRHQQAWQRSANISCRRPLRGRKHDKMLTYADICPWVIIIIIIRHTFQYPHERIGIVLGRPEEKKTAKTTTELQMYNHIKCSLSIQTNHQTQGFFHISCHRLSLLQIPWSRWYQIIMKLHLPAESGKKAPKWNSHHVCSNIVECIWNIKFQFFWQIPRRKRAKRGFFQLALLLSFSTWEFNLALHQAGKKLLATRLTWFLLAVSHPHVGLDLGEGHHVEVALCLMKP